MARYALPIVLFSAIAAVLVIWVRSSDSDSAPGSSGAHLDREKTAESNGAEDPNEKRKSGLLGGTRNTPTSLRRHRWLSELERVLARGDFSRESHAAHFRSKVTESMDEILADSTLTHNLLAAIKKYAIEDRNPEARKLLLPILRVMTTPEATELIEQEYYRVSDESERIVLLEAMAVAKHNPETAAPWAVDMAVHAEDANYRHLAFEYYKVLTLHPDTVTEVAMQIYDSTERPEQRLDALAEIARRAPDSEKGRKFIRKRLRDTRAEELTWLLGTIEGWGTEKDAIFLESIAGQYPAMSEGLREQAERIRTHRRMMAAQEGRPQLPPPDDEGKR